MRIINFTKKQRHEIYKKALDYFNKSPDLLCPILCYVSGLDALCVAYVDTPQYFEEFKIQKPKGKGEFASWWPRNDVGNKKRKAVLLECIRETAPKKRKKVSNQTK